MARLTGGTIMVPQGSEGACPTVTYTHLGPSHGTCLLSHIRVLALSHHTHPCVYTCACPISHAPIRAQPSMQLPCTDAHALIPIASDMGTRALTHLLSCSLPLTHPHPPKGHGPCTLLSCPRPLACGALGRSCSCPCAGRQCQAALFRRKAFLKI